jgi:hypothetical protein
MIFCPLGIVPERLVISEAATPTVITGVGVDDDHEALVCESFDNTVEHLQCSSVL